jgi:hypothetical protein
MGQSFIPKGKTFHPYEQYEQGEEYRKEGSMPHYYMEEKPETPEYKAAALERARKKAWEQRMQELEPREIFRGKPELEDELNQELDKPTNPPKSAEDIMSDDNSPDKVAKRLEIIKRIKENPEEFEYENGFPIVPEEDQ